MKIRERVGESTPERFDYQLAVAIDFLISAKEPITILIETLEDFAIIQNINNSKNKVDVYQVKTIEKGLMDKSNLIQHNV